MTDQNETPATVRKIFFTGALQAIDRQLEYLAAERKRVAGQLDQAKEDLVQGKNPPSPAKK